MNYFHIIRNLYFTIFQYVIESVPQGSIKYLSNSFITLSTYNVNLYEKPLSVFPILTKPKLSNNR